MKELIQFINSHLDFWQWLNKQEIDSLRAITSLKKSYPRYPLSALISQVQLRRRAHTRITNADQMLFTKKGLEQCSSTVLASYHAQLFAPYRHIADLCCGIGHDFIHLAANKTTAYAVDNNVDTLATCAYNTSSADINNATFISDNAENFSFNVDVIFADPDRRTSARRIINPEEMSPSLSAILSLHKFCAGMAIKLSPAIDYEKINYPQAYTLEFIAENNQLKEILMCTACLATPGINKKAIILPAMLTMTDNTPQSSIISPIMSYLYEPNVAIIRAHLVQHLAAELNCSRINEHIALLTSDEEISTLYAKCYSVHKIIKHDMKLLKKILKNQKIGNLVIKTRGYPLTVEEFRKKIKLNGKNSATLFIIRLAKKHVFCLTEFCRHAQ